MRIFSSAAAVTSSMPSVSSKRSSARLNSEARTTNRCRPRWSRSTHKRGVSGSASTCMRLPLTFRVIIEELLKGNPRRYFLLCRRLCVVGAGMRKARKRLGWEAGNERCSARAEKRGARGPKRSFACGVALPSGATPSLRCWTEPRPVPRPRMLRPRQPRSIRFRLCLPEARPATRLRSGPLEPRPRAPGPGQAQLARRHGPRRPAKRSGPAAFSPVLPFPEGRRPGFAGL